MPSSALTASRAGRSLLRVVRPGAHEARISHPPTGAPTATYFASAWKYSCSVLTICSSCSSLVLLVGPASSLPRSRLPSRNQSPSPRRLVAFTLPAAVEIVIAHEHCALLGAETILSQPGPRRPSASASPGSSPSASASSLVRILRAALAEIRPAHGRRVLAWAAVQSRRRAGQVAFVGAVLLLVSSPHVSLALPWHGPHPSRPTPGHHRAPIGRSSGFVKTSPPPDA